MNKTVTWSKNVMLINATFLDSVAFDLIVNFERMLNRPIPKADLCHWLDCVALDGGLEKGDNEILVVLVHSKGQRGLENFVPSDYASELDAKAFKDSIGEFSLVSLPVEDMVSEEDFFMDILTLATDAKEVENLMVVPDAEKLWADVESIAAKAENKNISLFTMTPQFSKVLRQEILGYSLMSALGIKGEELR